jgi:hypothetical protein
VVGVMSRTVRFRSIYSTFHPLDNPISVPSRHG